MKCAHGDSGKMKLEIDDFSESRDSGCTESLFSSDNIANSNPVKMFCISLFPFSVLQSVPTVLVIFERTITL